VTDRPAPGAQLFFLDDCAVLFSEPRQELHELNTMAAVIWCHLEDGKDRAAIAGELVSGLGVPPADAARFVDQALDTWRLQGLLEDARGPAHAPPLPSRPGVEDVPAFGAPDFVTERHYRLLGIGFRLRCTAAEDDALLAPVLTHLASAGAAVTSFDVVRHGGGIAIYRDGRPLASCRDRDELVPTVHGLTWLELADLHGFFLELHAGVVGSATLGDEGGCILLPARPGSGKSTLTAALVHAGWSYLSDEAALLDAATMRVAPVPIAFCLKPGGIAPVAAFWPAARLLPFHMRMDGKRVAYLPPPADRTVLSDARLKVRGIAFVRYREGHARAINPLSRLDALRRLIGECVAISGRLDVARVGALVDWIAGVPCIELVYGSTEDGVTAIGEAFGLPATGTAAWRGAAGGKAGDA